MLRDAFGRIATDLRISVTDKCDLRCMYCMPEEGLPWTPSDEILDFDEIERLLHVLVGEGVETVRITGGEPLLRRHLHELVERISLLGVDDIALTTNGTLLERHAGPLKDAGLTRVNVSLDTLQPERFEVITRRNRFERVMKGLEEANRVGLGPIKINCVVMKGVNDRELIPFAELARSTGYDVRFIEFLPLDADDQWSNDRVVSSREVLGAIGERFPLVLEHSDGPATNHRFADGAPGTIGVIASVSEPFCSTCDRIRLTADGQFRSCLFSSGELDLRSMLRGGADDEEIAVAIRGEVGAKQAGHGIGTPAFIKPRRSMSAIGG